MPRLRLLIAAAAALLALASPAAARPAAAARAKAHPQAKVEAQPGVRHLHFRFGPIRVKPGQNTIVFRTTRGRPKVPGFITSFRPNLVRADGKAPPTDVIHLHHAVWLVNLNPTWAAGEEKTKVRLPSGFGWRYRPSDKWILNHMVHNLTPGTDRVRITWDMDIVPAASPAARHIHAVDTDCLDEENGKIDPVFEAVHGIGR